MAKHPKKNNKRMKRVIKTIVNDIKSLDFVVNCCELIGRGPTSKGSYENPYVEYVKDTKSGLIGRIHVGCGYQTVHVIVKNSSSSLNGEDPRRPVIRYFVYYYQLPNLKRNYNPPALQDVIDPTLFKERVMRY